jgi:hypothetical protein
MAASGLWDAPTDPERELIKIALNKQRSIPAAELDRSAVKQFVRQALAHLAGGRGASTRV